MVSLKYAKDFRLDTYTDEKGKVKDCTVYVGPLYEWAISGQVLKKYRIKLLLLTLLQIVLFVSSLWNYSDLTRLWWVVVPYSCLFLVFVLQCMVCYNLFVLKGQMQREQKDKTVDRLKGCSVMGCILSGISIVSTTGSLIANMVNIQFWDIYYIIVEMVLFIIFLYNMKSSGTLLVKELVNPVAEEWKDK